MVLDRRQPLPLLLELGVSPLAGGSLDLTAAQPFFWVLTDRVDGIEALQAGEPDLEMVACWGWTGRRDDAAGAVEAQRPTTPPCWLATRRA